VVGGKNGLTLAADHTDIAATGTPVLQRSTGKTPESDKIACSLWRVAARLVGASGTTDSRGSYAAIPLKRQAATFGESPYRYQNVYIPLDNGPALSRRAFA
jgi:hypothetical protein